MDGQALRRRYIETMLEKVDDTRFPSNELLDRIESTLVTEDEVTAYGAVLMAKVEDIRFPSSDLVRRLEAIVSRFPVSPNGSE